MKAPSAAPFSFCLHSSPTPGSFLMSWLFVSGGQRTRVSASASVFPVNKKFYFGWLFFLVLLPDCTSRHANSGPSNDCPQTPLAVYLWQETLGGERERQREKVSSPAQSPLHGFNLDLSCFTLKPFSSQPEGGESMALSSTAWIQGTMDCGP